MKKLGVPGLKWLKSAHLLFMVLMLGGIISSVALRIGMALDDFDQVYMSYKLMFTVSEYVVRYGAQGLLITGIVYGVWTNWGWFRYRWITVKWIVFLGQTIFGIAFIDRWMVENLGILEAERNLALSNPVFVRNHLFMEYGAIAQAVVTVGLIAVSVWKPWNKKRQA